MNIYILDASVILSFLLSESKTVAHNIQLLLKEAQQNKNKLYSSCLLRLEVGNGLRYTIKEPEISKNAFSKFLVLPITYFDLTTIHYQKTLTLSYQLKTSFYDTSYHVLAQILSGIFLTCDNKYYQRAKNIGGIKFLN